MNCKAIPEVKSTGYNLLIEYGERRVEGRGRSVFGFQMQFSFSSCISNSCWVMLILLTMCLEMLGFLIVLCELDDILAFITKFISRASAPNPDSIPSTNGLLTSVDGPWPHRAKLHLILVPLH